LESSEEIQGFFYSNSSTVQ